MGKSLPFREPPKSLCLLRLSALGDVINILPVVRTLQRHWPETELSWLIGRPETALVGDLPGVRFIEFDKTAGWRGYRGLRRRLAGERFDALLHMQFSLRANLLSGLVPASVRLGFDRAASREGHGLFVNHRIQRPPGRHVIDSYFAFVEALGIRERVMEWSVPIPAADREIANGLLRDAGRVLAISPCSSHSLRNWRAERYAAVADYAAREHGYTVVLLGAPSQVERQMADAIIAAMSQPALDLVGRTSLKTLLALLERADVALTPDSGPAHFANAVGTDVISLFACSESARAGPYNSLAWCVDRFETAARRFRGVEASQLRWGAKIELPGVMDLIEVDDVIAQLEVWRAQRVPAARGASA